MSIKIKGKQLAESTITQELLNLTTPLSADTSAAATVEYVNVVGEKVDENYNHLNGVVDYKNWASGQTYTTVDNYVLFSDTSNPSYITPQYYRILEDILVDESPITNPEKFEWQGDSLASITIDKIVGLDYRLRVTELEILYVDLNALGSNNGTSWVDAYTDLQLALDAVKPGQEIWIAEGTYVPSKTDSTKTFTIKHSNVKLKGGFRTNSIGDEVIISGETILSGTYTSGSTLYFDRVLNIGNENDFLNNIHIENIKIKDYNSSSYAVDFRNINNLYIDNLSFESIIMNDTFSGMKFFKCDGNINNLYINDVTVGVNGTYRIFMAIDDSNMKFNNINIRDCEMLFTFIYITGNQNIDDRNSFVIDIDNMIVDNVNEISNSSFIASAYNVSIFINNLYFYNSTLEIFSNTNSESNLYITNSVIRNNTFNGYLFFINTGGYLYLYNCNTIDNNPVIIFDIRQNASFTDTLVFVKNTIISNITSFTGVGQEPYLTIDNSLTEIEYTGSGTTNLSGTPLFEDEVNNDYRLKADSLGILHGQLDLINHIDKLLLNKLEYDIQGIRRTRMLQNNKLDIGAYESPQITGKAEISNIDNTTITYIGGELRSSEEKTQFIDNIIIASGVTSGNTTILLEDTPIGEYYAYINGIRFMVSTVNGGETRKPFFFIGIPTLGSLLYLNTSILGYDVEVDDLIEIKYEFINQV